MKKLQIMSIVLLLFGIWLSNVSIAPNSKIPELVCITAVAAGLVCAVISLFGKDK